MIQIIFIFLLIIVLSLSLNNCFTLTDVYANRNEYCKNLEPFDQYYNIRNTDIKNGNPEDIYNLLNDTRSKLEINKHQIDQLENSGLKTKSNLQTLTNVVSKLYTTDMGGDYVVNGWFVQFHNILDTPEGVVLGEIIHRIYGAPIICFKTKDSFPFLGYPDKPMFFPKADNIGFRAITILKIPKTGYYDFRSLTNDGMRIFYQKISSDVIFNEKNVRSTWNLCIDSWINQADVWLTSKKLYFNQNDLILVRMDHYELSGYASGCIKLRHYTDDSLNRIEETDLPYENLFCSLLWSEVPLLGFV
jgi:hypothetical protein